MKNEIRKFLQESDLLFPKYNRNISRKKVWDNINYEWSLFLFNSFEQMNSIYPISFVDFLKKFIFDDESIIYYSSELDFIKRTPVVQINEGTKHYKIFFDKSKKLINFEPTSFTEIIYCVRNDIVDRPKCKECEEMTQFTVYKNGYRTFCSQKCQIIYNNKQKEIKESDLSDNEIRELISKIPLDHRNLSNEIIASNFVNISNYSKHFGNLTITEKIYVFFNKLSLNDISCETCNKIKIFKSQGIGYTKTCGRKSCIDVARFGTSYYKENDLNIKVAKGGESFENGFLYILFSQSLSAYKIGISQDPISRLYSLRKNINDLEIKECCWLNADLGKTEKEFHNIFNGKKAIFERSFDGYTEFFYLEQDDINFMKRVIYERK